MFRKPDGAGKGDAPRPTDWEKFSNNFDAIFKKKMTPQEQQKELREQRERKEREQND